MKRMMGETLVDVITTHDRFSWVRETGSSNYHTVTTLNLREPPLMAGDRVSNGPQKGRVLMIHERYAFVLWPDECVSCERISDLQRID